MVYREATFPMALRILLSIAAIYMALVGLGFIFAPQAIGMGAVSASINLSTISTRKASLHRDGGLTAGFSSGWVRSRPQRVLSLHAAVTPPDPTYRTHRWAACWSSAPCDSTAKRRR